MSKTDSIWVKMPSRTYNSFITLKSTLMNELIEFFMNFIGLFFLKINFSSLNEFLISLLDELLLN